MNDVSIRLARVVSIAKVCRRRARSAIRFSITRPAAIPAAAGLNAERPWAMTSALTNSVTERV
jgi:hypothetical protein